MRVAVVGGGLAGLTAAHYLHVGGAVVSVFERENQPGSMTSSRNGSLLHPSMVEPWNEPGVLGMLLRNLGNSNSAMLLRLHALPGLMGWGLHFVRESSSDRYHANTLANVALAQHSLDLMKALRELGVQYDAYRRGSLAVLRSPEALAKARKWREWMAPHGVPFTLLSRDELVALEPALAPIAAELVGATHQLDDEGGDPLRFVQSLAAMLQSRGVTMHLGLAVERVMQSNGRVSGLQLGDGSQRSFDAVVLAAAAWSVPLAASAGLSVPVKPVKGYSLTLPRQGPDGIDHAPRIPVVDPRLHMAVTPVGDNRVRVAGTAEFTGFDLHVRPERVANLTRLVTRLYPQYLAALPANAAEPWTGLRPMSPDGVALIGATRLPGLYLNTGQGHTGWTVAAASGHLLACAVLNQSAPIDVRPYSPRRFADL